MNQNILEGIARGFVAAASRQVMDGGPKTLLAGRPLLLGVDPLDMHFRFRSQGTDDEQHGQ